MVVVARTDPTSSLHHCGGRRSLTVPRVEGVVEALVWGVDSAWGRCGPIKNDLEMGGPPRLLPFPLPRSLPRGP
jgi:hypothetical protein